MTEKQLQYQCVVWFGQQYPELQDMLIEVNNNAMNIKHYSSRIGMGMTVGASDLMLWHKGVLIAIELKAMESTHKISHIKNQLEFGDQIIDNYGYFFLLNTLSSFQFIVKLVLKKSETLKFYQQKNREIITKLLKKNEKTVKFNEKLL